MKEKIAQGYIHFGDDETTVPNKKTYLKDTLTQSLTSIKYRDGRVASKKLTALLGSNVFSNPKDSDLLGRLFKAIGISVGDIVLDFFSGSGTTGETIQNFISENLNVSFILVQIQEDLDKSLERATGSGKAIVKNAIEFCDKHKLPHTLDNIALERLKKVRDRNISANPLFHGDLGFRHFTLKEPSGIALEKIIKFDKNTAFGDNTLMEEFGVPTILTTWLERDGYGLTSDYHSLDLGGYTAYYIDKHLYLINPDLSDDAVAVLLDKYQTEASFNPQNVVIYGYSFGWNELQSLKDSLQTVQAGEKNLRINFEIRY